jgi:hypothetical protein
LCLMREVGFCEWMHRFVQCDVPFKASIELLCLCEWSSRVVW